MIAPPPLTVSVLELPAAPTYKGQVVVSLLPVPLTIKELPVAVAWLPIATLLVPLAFVMDPTPPSENARLLLLPASPIHRLSLPPLDVPLKFKLLFVIFDPTHRDGIAV